MADKTISALAEELLARQLQDNPRQFDAPQPMDLGLEVGPSPTTLGPEKAALIGGLADAASTYTFLKRGSAREANAMWKGLDNHPAATALGVAGGALGFQALRALMRRMGMNGVADTLAGNQGGYQMGLAANNLQMTSRKRGSSDARTATMLHDGISRSK